MATAKTVDGTYDLMCFFDCLHDMGDPAGARAHVRGHLAPGGALVLIEPFAGDSLDDNLHLVGATYYAFSTLLCTPSSLSQEIRRPGRREPPARHRHECGFSRALAGGRDFDIVLEATVSDSGPGALSGQVRPRVR